MSGQKRVYQTLETMNRGEDPWATQHPYNQKAFNQLLLLINLVPHASILEIGCAQGAFTKRLLEISKEVTGIDVSESAVKQAKMNAPAAQFFVSSLEDFHPKRQYDVIVCSEILYYIKDRKKAIKKLETLGNYLVTSHYLFCLPGVSFGSLKYEWSLRKFPLIKRLITTYPIPPTLTVRALRKLRT